MDSPKCCEHFARELRFWHAFGKGKTNTFWRQLKLRISNGVLLLIVFFGFDCVSVMRALRFVGTNLVGT